MVNIIKIVRDFWPVTLVPIGFMVGWYFDVRYDEKMSGFRNKSKLYQRLVIWDSFIPEQTILFVAIFDKSATSV